MALDPTRAEILDELKRLRKFRLEALAKATFVGFMRDEILLEEGRLERIAVLRRMLEEFTAEVQTF
jgi:hypothetical protein